MAINPAVQAAAEAIAGCATDEFAEMDRPQRVWYLNLADAALKAAAPLIRAQAFTEAADAIQATVYYVYPPPEGEARARLEGLRKARGDAAALVRGLGEETENA